MAMLSNLMKSLLERAGIPDPGVRRPADSKDSGIVTPNQLQYQAQKPPAGTVTDDGGMIRDFNPGNPFANALKGKGEPGTIRNFLDRLSGSGGLEPGTGTVGGGVGSDHVPGTGTDAALDPTPMRDQKQATFGQKSGTSDQPLDVPLPQPRPPEANPYAQPTALDPTSIEQLRQSLLTQTGQLDPNNPNGLSGRMNSPNSVSDMGQQRNDAMGIEDSIRGFDGVRKAKIAEGNR